MSYLFKRIASLLLINYCLLPSIIAAELKENQHILILNSYHPQYKWTQQLIKGATAELTQFIPPENIHIEYMDSRRFADDKQHLQRILNLYQYSYQKFKPSLVLTSDDAAFNFIVDYGDSLFPNTPVVFSGVNVFDERKIKNKPNITGIKEGMEIEENLRLIQLLQPKLKTIFVLGDKTGLGLEMANRALTFRHQWSANKRTQHITLEILTDFSISEFNKRAKSFDSTSAILILAIHKDNTGHYFSYDYDLPLLTKTSNAPVYGMWGGGLIIDNGAVGGLLNDPFEHGASAAKLALKILDGQAPKEIPIQEKSLFSPHFDYEQLQRFNISESNLPPNSKIINKPESLYQKHTIVVNITLLVFILLNIIITLLLKNIKQRKRNQAQLSKFNQELEILVHDRTAELEKQKNEIEYLANHDALTGLPTLRLSLDRLHMAINSADRNKAKAVLLFLDLDGFKAINDKFGHDAGDEILRNIALKIKLVIRDTDTASRIGGDEFLVILPNIKSNPQIEKCCQRLLEAIQKPIVYQQSKLNVGVSIGGAIYPDNANDAASLRKEADRVMYEVKNSGKNNFQLA